MTSLLHIGCRVPNPDGGELELVEYLGGGAFAAVFLCRSVSPPERQLALKTISAWSLTREEYAALLNEGELAAAIQHENVVNIAHFHDGRSGDVRVPYLLMEYCEGGTLSAMLAGLRTNGETLPLDGAVGMCLCLASGMQAINDMLIHRDIKPDNILIANNTLKIADFGLSKVALAATRTQSFKGIQDCRYKPPEAWLGDANTVQLDMYSMGLVFGEVLSLKHLLDPDGRCESFPQWRERHLTRAPIPLADARPDCPHNIAEVVSRMIRKNSDDRPRSWQEIQDAMTKSKDPLPNAQVQALVNKVQKRAESESRDAEQRELARNASAERLTLVKIAAASVFDTLAGMANEANAAHKLIKLSVKREELTLRIQGQAGALEMSLTATPEFSIQDGRTLNACSVGIGVGKIYVKDTGCNLLVSVRKGESTPHVRVCRNRVSPLVLSSQRDDFVLTPDELMKQMARLGAMSRIESDLKSLDASADFLWALIGQVV